MVEDLSIEEKIAKFLIANHITIVPARDERYESLNFMRYHPITGNPEEIGTLAYEPGSGRTAGGAGVEGCRRMLEVPGFINEVIRPLERLLRQADGDFYNQRFDPIHEACDQLELKESQGYLGVNPLKISDLLK